MPSMMLAPLTIPVVAIRKFRPVKRTTHTQVNQGTRSRKTSTRSRTFVLSAHPSERCDLGVGTASQEKHDRRRRLVFRYH